MRVDYTQVRAPNIINSSQILTAKHQLAMRQTWEEIGVDLAEKDFMLIGQLDDREITTSLGKRLLMILSPFGTSCPSFASASGTARLTEPPLNSMNLNPGASRIQFFSKCPRLLLRLTPHRVPACTGFRFPPCLLQPLHPSPKTQRKVGGGRV